MPLTSPELTPVQVDEISSGNQSVWVDGVAYYEDVGGKGRETHFRYIYDPKADFFLPDATAPEFNRRT